MVLIRSAVVGHLQLAGSKCFEQDAVVGDKVIGNGQVWSGCFFSVADVTGISHLVCIQVQELQRGQPLHSFAQRNRPGIFQFILS